MSGPSSAERSSSDAAAVTRRPSRSCICGKRRGSTISRSGCWATPPTPRISSRKSSSWRIAKLASFKGESALATYLDHLRSKAGTMSRRTDLLDGEPLPASATAPQATELAVSRLDLERAIGALPDGCRAAYVLHDVEGYDHQQVGALLGIAEGTSKSQVHKARLRIRGSPVRSGERPPAEAGGDFRGRAAGRSTSTRFRATWRSPTWPCSGWTPGTISGNVGYSGPLTSGGRYHLKAHAGTVRVLVAGSVGFEVRASSFSGGIKTDLPLTRSETGGGRRGPERRLQGTYGDGSALLDLTSFSGTIVIGKR